MSKKVNLVQNKKNNKKVKTINYLLIPLIFVMSAIPLIVRYLQYNTNTSNIDYFSSAPNRVDLFLYYKSIFVIIMASLMIFIFIYMKFAEDYTFKSFKIFIPLGIYICAVVLSTVLSNNRYFSLHGIFDHFESMWVLLGYCLITFYGYQFINTEQDLKTIKLWFYISIGLTTLIGISQAIGKDFYFSDLGKSLIIPRELQGKVEMTGTFENTRVYLSQFNPNYVGLLMSLIIPFLIVNLLFSKKIKDIIINMLLLIASLICLFGSGARNGIIAIAATMILLLIFLRNLIIKNMSKVIVTIIIIGIAFVVVNFTGNNFILNQVKSIVGELKTDNVKPPLEEIQTNSDGIKIIYNGNSLLLYFNELEEQSYELRLKDSDENDLTQLYDGATGIINDSRFSNFIVMPAVYNNYMALKVNINGYDWNFSKLDDGYYYINEYGKYVKISKIKTVLFNNNLNMGSGRGYIWASTIPLLPKYFFVGSGPDTFPLVYPQNSYVEKYNYGSADIVIDKPHNMYLQIGVQTGVISLIALLAGYGMYFIWSIKLYFRNDFTTISSQIGLAIFISTIGYMVSGVFNDATVGVTPVFWAFLGVGLAANYMFQNSIKNKKNN